jgi:hypothetical protein
MTGVPTFKPVDVNSLSDRELALGLQTAVTGGFWPEQAAVGLLVTQPRWLGSWELRKAVEAEVGPFGLRAWVDWTAVTDGPASSGQLRILELVRSLAGIATGWSLADLLTGLDDINVTRVLEAVELACRGPSSLRQSRLHYPTTEG